jgi:hypothetical protein
MSITLAGLRAEMARLTGVMMAKNALYLKREAEIMDEFKHDKLKLAARLDDDIVLNNASAVAKTCATLAGAMAAVIQAELAYEARYRKRGNIKEVIETAIDDYARGRGANITGPPPMEPPISTRPQDWSPQARAHIFGRSERA